jgi:hypothetical protein
LCERSGDAPPAAVRAIPAAPDTVGMAEKFCWTGVLGELRLKPTIREEIVLESISR